MTTLHTYDDLGRRLTSRLESSPFSGVAWSQETEYVDAVPTIRRQKDARQHTTVLELDGLDRVVKETDPLGNSVQTTWDGATRRLVRDKRGNTTRFDYDRANRVVKVTDPAPFQLQTVETTYQDALNRVSEKDRRGNLKLTQTDPLGRVLTITRAQGTPEETVVERNAYDALGNKVLATDGAGKKTQFVYDRANRLASQVDGFDSAEAATTEYRYDGNGNRTKLIDPRSSETEPSAEYGYDELNRVTDEWDGERNHTQYAYDEEGDRTSVTTPKLAVTSFDYDELKKLTRVVQPAASSGEAVATTQYRYDANRNRVRQTDADGHVVAMEYDELNRLRKTVQDPADGGSASPLVLVSETTRLDANGNPEEVVDAKGQKTTSTFDELNRLKSQAHAFAPGDTTRPWRHTVSVDYTYDASGNLLQSDEHVASGSDPPARRSARRTSTTASTA